MVLYTYSDGSGNTYRIGAASIKYDPVMPMESSSGIYSGGDPVDIAISAEQRQQLIDLFELAFKNRTFRIDKRTLGSAEIRRTIINEDSEEEVKQVIIAMRSPEKSKIESLMEQLKKSQ